MGLEKISRQKIDEADLGWKTQKYVYPISDLRANGVTGVISQRAVIQHFKRCWPDLKIKKIHSFKINPIDQTVTLVIKVTEKVNRNLQKIAELEGQVDKLEEEVLELRTQLKDRDGNRKAGG